MVGLYDQRGMLRYAGPGPAECLAYAELFALPVGSFCLEPLFSAGFPQQGPAESASGPVGRLRTSAAQEA